MKALIQLVIKFFLRLLSPNSPNDDRKNIDQTVAQPEPLVTEPKAEEPATPEPVVEAEEDTETGPVPASQGLQFKEVFAEAASDNKQLKSIKITDGKKEGSFRRFNSTKRNWEGWYTAGQRPIKDFILAEASLLDELEMTQSSQNLLQAVSENEGKLEAINAYDGAFLSFGIFQWTLGTRDNVGELPALMKKIRNTYPDTFQQFFGRYGIEVSEETNAQTGYLTLNGKVINKRDLKEQFRGKEWVYRFWRAGGDPKVQAVEVEHALSRLKTFYWRYKVHGFTLNKIITSEYGVALLLDNHVNLPGLVRRALKAAMDETGLTDPSNWGSAEERQVLDAYIKHRATRVDGVGPMFDAINRAKRTAKYLEDGTISDERGSLRVTHTRSRGMLVENHVSEPDDFNQADYPEMDLDMEGRDMEFMAREE